MTHRQSMAKPSSAGGDSTRFSGNGSEVAVVPCSSDLGRIQEVRGCLDGKALGGTTALIKDSASKPELNTASFLLIFDSVV